MEVSISGDESSVSGEELQSEEFTVEEIILAKRALIESLSNGERQRSKEDHQWNQELEDDSVQHMLETVLQELSVRWTCGGKETSLNSIAKSLADSTTSVPFWRIAFGEHGILDFFLGKLQEYGDDSAEWVVDALRLVANCCAGDESNANREHVMKRPPFARLLRLLKSPKHARIAVVALYSICADFEPAQEAAQERYDLSLALLDYLSRDYIAVENVSLVFELLPCALHKCDIEQFPNNTVELLLWASKRFETVSGHEDREVSVVLVIMSFLKHDRHQNQLIRCEFQEYCDFFRSRVSLWDTIERDDLAQTQTDLIKVLGTVALGADLEEISSLPCQIMISWLSLEQPPVQICALVFLGNLAYKSEKLRLDLVGNKGAGEYLATVIKTSSNDQVLTSAFDLLQNLAQERGNREALGKASMLEALSRCWSKDKSAPSRQRAFYHTRQLLKGSMANVYRFLVFKPTPQSSHRTLIHSLLCKFKETQDPATRAEAGRTLAEIWRSIHNDPDFQKSLPCAIEQTAKEEYVRGIDKIGLTWAASLRELPLCWHISQAVKEIFSDFPDIANPSLALIESENPSLMTEGWFTMALMAKWKEGAPVVYNTLCAKGTLEMVKSVLQSPKNGSKDYDNALHVVNELRKYLGDDAVCGPVLQSLLP